jgi:hypothetical protein
VTASWTLGTRVTVLGALLTATVLSAGCASGTKSEWVKPGATEEQLARDKNDCLFDSEETVPTAQGPQRRVNQDRYRRCLQARGYELKVGPASQ